MSRRLEILKKSLRPAPVIKPIQNLTSYFPVDLDLRRLHLINKKEALRDFEFETKLNKEISLTQRRKQIRVSVLWGMQKQVEQTGKKKKKKR